LGVPREQAEVKEKKSKAYVGNIPFMFSIRIETPNGGNILSKRSRMAGEATSS